MNIASIVNAGHDSVGLEQALALQLEQLLTRVPWLRGWKVRPVDRDRPWDFRASGPVAGGGEAVLCVECKTSNFQPSGFSALVKRHCAAGQRVSRRVLAMPRVSPRMAALCQEHDWSWFDLAGNCRLEIPGVLLIERSGNEPVKTAPRSGANLGTPEAERVIRALLAPEHAGQRWTQRQMVAHFSAPSSAVSAPSLALVNKVVQHLRNQAFLERLAHGGFRVVDYDGLLRAWREAYRFHLHSRQRFFTLLQGRALHDRLHALASVAERSVAYAAFSAADFQAPAVRQPRTWLYLEPGLEQQFRAAIEAKAVDSGENIVVLFPRDRGVFYRLDAGSNRLACTNAVQTYIDLAHAGGRGDEAAEAVLQQCLKPAWQAESR